MIHSSLVARSSANETDLFDDKELLQQQSQVTEDDSATYVQQHDQTGSNTEKKKPLTTGGIVAAPKLFEYVIVLTKVDKLSYHDILTSLKSPSSQSQSKTISSNNSALPGQRAIALDEMKEHSKLAEDILAYWNKLVVVGNNNNDKNSATTSSVVRIIISSIDKEYWLMFIVYCFEIGIITNPEDYSFFFNGQVWCG